MLTLLVGGTAFAQTGPITVEDERGRTLTFDTSPQRFAACSSFALETLMALGVEPVVRIHTPPVFPPEAESIPVVARSHSTGPDVEMLIATAPDAILLHNVFGEFADTVQSSVGVPVVLHQVKSLADIDRYVGMLGRLAGKTDRANELLGELHATIDWMRNQPQPARAPKALALLGTSDTWYAYRRNAFMGDLLEVLGVENVAAEAEAHAKHRTLAPLDLERIVEQDPDVLFVIPYGGVDPDTIENFMAHPAFASLRAVRDGRVYVLTDRIYSSHAGLRSGEALRTLYGLIYPDRPSPPGTFAANSP
ncbi:MAG: ABC transporter substrate-binding protein [Planctomycetota bacterium]